MIAGISQYRLIYWERRRGSYRKDDCCQWLRCLLCQVHEPMSDAVIVCDNAPVHVSLGSVLEEEFNGALPLRLVPCSAPLNHIEECWSVVKSVIKRQLNITLQDLLNTPPVGITQTEHRLRHLEKPIDLSTHNVTPILCMKTCNHVQKYFHSCLALVDPKMGGII